MIKNLSIATFGALASHRVVSTRAFGAQARPLITSTFFEPDNGIFGGWSEQDWSTYFLQYKALGIERVLTHWTSNHGCAFTGMKDLIKGANIAQIKIVVGLTYGVPCRPKNNVECPYDANIEVLKNYLQKTYLEVTNIVENHLPEDLQDNSSFDGWYLAEEVDGITLADSNRTETGPRVVKADRADAWRKYFLESLDYLEGKWTRSETMRVYTSAYFGQKPHMSGKEFASFWQNVWADVPPNVDFTVLLQDERGTDRLTVAELQDYVETLKAVFGGTNRKFGLILELFDDGAAGRSPTTIAKLKAQIETVQAITLQSGGLISEISSFCASHDLFNARVAGQAQVKTPLGEAYRAYLQTPA